MKACALILACLATAPLSGQGYRVRLDTRFQAVAFRGLVLDSISAGDTVTGPGGGPATADGFAVHCAAGDAYCTYFRPGSRHTAAPLVSTIDATAWGFGMRRLSAHASARLGFDAGDAGDWSGTTPAGQLLSGYVEYAAERMTARAGRQLMFSRFGSVGYDGASLTVRLSRQALDLSIFGGWGLGRGSALPVTSPALNPIDDFQPRQRQLLAGIDAGFHATRGDARLVYQREVDPRSDYFVSERIGLAGALRPTARWTLSAGADYDLAAGWWGSAELALAYTARPLNASVEVRRYRPHFELWTIWGAFSPVPYQSVRANVSVTVNPRLRLHVRGERYAFADAEAATPLVSAEHDGWRGELGASFDPVPGWSIDAGYRREFGPGAASVGTGASVSYAPDKRYRVLLHASTLDRPLEFRFSESVLRVLGVEASADVNERWRISLGGARYAEERQRPDAASFDWNQWRAQAGFTVLFGSGSDLENLPPAMRRLPGGRNAR